MKTNESLLHKGMRTIIQSSLRMQRVLDLPAASS